eukprot:scaffold1938_cov399-Prasinococcus_capsulatus_cf.AAC.17
MDMASPGRYSAPRCGLATMVAHKFEVYSAGMHSVGGHIWWPRVGCCEGGATSAAALEMALGSAACHGLVWNAPIWHRGPAIRKLLNGCGRSTGKTRSRCWPRQTNACLGRQRLDPAKEGTGSRRTTLLAATAVLCTTLAEEGLAAGEDIADGMEDLNNKSLHEGANCLASGLCYVDVHVGQGERVQTGDIVVAQVRAYTKKKRLPWGRVTEDTFLDWREQGPVAVEVRCCTVAPPRNHHRLSVPAPNPLRLRLE